MKYIVLFTIVLVFAACGATATANMDWNPISPLASPLPEPQPEPLPTATQIAEWPFYPTPIPYPSMLADAEWRSRIWHTETMTDTPAGEIRISGPLTYDLEHGQVQATLPICFNWQSILRLDPGMYAFQLDAAEPATVRLNDSALVTADTHDMQSFTISNGGDHLLSVQHCAYPTRAWLDFDLLRLGDY